MSFFGISARKAEPKSTGARGEELAVQYLKKNKYKILARNIVPDGHEEIDIIAETREERIFVEVKTRTGDPSDEWKYGTPATAVTLRKRKHLLNAARAYNCAHPTKKQLRMDVMEVYLPREQEKEPILHHITDAFRS